MTQRIIVGDAIEVLQTLDEASIHTCITSPPYYGQRDYNVKGQLGLEATPEEYVAALVAVFREVRRVLRDDGTVWLNLGDSYAQKDLIGIPWRVAFALQADGWYLRSDIIWAKPNPMPESVTDRCTKSHEYIFLLVKSKRYYYDHEAIKVPAVMAPGKSGFGGPKLSTGALAHTNEWGKAWEKTDMKNRRDVWTVTTKPFKDAHFATFPPDLIEPCVLAGCPPGGIILDPFAGSGTVGGVASYHGRRSIMVELNAEYARMMPKRFAAVAEWLERIV
tara:strand:+ start:8 stop:835 length:828 start_codon:yes stop_codon:yes gene_type:complete